MLDTNLKFEREDWTAFRTIEGLQQKAGVAKDKLSCLVLKEITDNALDTGAMVKVGELRKKGGYFVEDAGTGINGAPQDIARLFSIARPLVSSKLLRLPQRGALGNGLRVVASAVLVSGGTLAVITRNKRIELRPERDGRTTVIKVTPAKQPVGTRIEIGFGSALPCDEYTLRWANTAIFFARAGKTYQGKSSPHWFDAPNFHELLSASGNIPVRDLIARLEVGGKVDKIVMAAGLQDVLCNAVTQKQSAVLFKKACDLHPVRAAPSELGLVGAALFPGHAYAKANASAVLGSDKPYAVIPFVVEAWATSHDNTRINVLVNRTPVTGDIYAKRDDREIDVFGCGLHYTVAKAPKDQHFKIWLNITTPYMPITSDGKEPDLDPFFDEIQKAIGKAVSKARKPKPDQGPLLPKRRRGRQDQESEAEYGKAVEAFCKLILQIRSRLDFRVGSRGYCYLLEHHGLGKGDFDAAEKLITDCRKAGDLPLDICAEDASRHAIGVEQIDKLDAPAKADALVDDLIKHGHEAYLPISLWDDPGVPYYVEVVTEKLGLRNLFAPVCSELHIPIVNFKGWSDVNARAAMMRRFAYWAARGKRCVLLLCGDHDPGGLLITDTMRKNLNDLSGAMRKNYRVDWPAVDANLIITRFGLNADFIDEHNLTWIDNLETSSGGHLDDKKHKDHNKDYVQDYIVEYGVKKCEANALVVEPTIGRQLCRDAILAHVPIKKVRNYEFRLTARRLELKAALEQTQK